ncbi:hypothetical protein NDU88_003024 [Pleurodeles waltl]|uniref:Uncharacterized protein n=2 Tax=Pleurodeles waltl TaxID=8319 RepID=A0AAV7KUE5_PLEWA|nr:hypothetical protein NDU88_003024 [Pleurodeles waltl]
MAVEVVSAGEQLVVLGLLVRFMVHVDVVHAGVCVDETGREEGEEEEGDTVEAVDVAVSVRGYRHLGHVRRCRNPPVYRPLVDLLTMKERHVIVTYWYLWNKGTKSKSHKQVGDGQMPRKCQLRVQRSFDWTEEAEVSAGTKRARDFPFGGRIPLALESRAEVFSRRKDANKPCYTQIVRLAFLDAAGAQEGPGGRKLDLQREGTSSKTKSPH